MPLTLIFTIGLSLLIAAVAAGLTARSRRARPAVMGAGLIAAIVGLYLTGVTQLAENGVQSLIDWFQRTPFTTVTAWGLGLAVGGLVLFVVGSFLSKTPKAPREPRATTPQVPGSSRPQVNTTRTAAPTQAPQQRAPKPAQKGLDAEDAEIEALLRKRGIM